MKKLSTNQDIVAYRRESEAKVTKFILKLIVLDLNRVSNIFSTSYVYTYTLETDTTNNFRLAVSDTEEKASQFPLTSVTSTDAFPRI